ncbi:Uncharacterized protein putative in bacteria [Rubellimicrobium thermophilum DSM 16684]|uniref:Uncharacterized protein putative in bacteria n=1 Tax=Rubellimicrobium thermophilum DSM 16684 TaxID=1123069 RepID=S9R7J1_9RHOB|nr:Uncharacterized protein putative in bacteria [Rubellimicrobium thermophilum DSM 16684]
MRRRSLLMGLGLLSLTGPRLLHAQEAETLELLVGTGDPGLSPAGSVPEDPLADSHALPRIVPAPPGSLPGEIHVYPDDFVLYWTISDGLALRYDVGIGRAGLYEAGEFTVGAKKEWPSWTPTPEMIAREPERYARWADGMPGGPDNPLGARALYLFTPERGDTMLRIHGTNAPETIGTAVSNGCVRLVNEDIIDLYERVPLHARVVLHPKGVSSDPGSGEETGDAMAASAPFPPAEVLPFPAQSALPPRAVPGACGTGALGVRDGRPLLIGRAETAPHDPRGMR